MDFGALPPEINSARMYAGAGAGPMLTAAAAWDQVAAELHSGAASYQSAVTGLTSGGWQGPASAAMAAAAAPYVAWLSSTATQCEQVANQARAAVSAYENAFAMTVPPPLIAANRAQQMLLVATNLLGQNTPAIMATEAHYGEMWAQDAAAMYGYAGNSAAASTLAPFVAPQQSTNQSGLAAQAAALAQATGTGAASHAQNMAWLLSAVPHALQSLASPRTGSSAASARTGALLGSTGASGRGAHGGGNNNSGAPGLGGWSGFLGAGKGASNTAADLGSDVAGVGSDFGGLGTSFVGTSQGFPGADGLTEAGGLGPLGGLGVSERLSGGLSGVAPPAGLSGAGASASMGQAASLGPLSVPQNWAEVAAASPGQPASAVAAPASNLGAAPAVAAVGPPMSRVPTPSLAAREADAAIQKFGLMRFTVIPNSPMAG